jgi:hypothetical protein
VDVEDGRRIAGSLAGRIDRLTFRDLTTDAVTALIIDAVVDWGRDRGWRVYRRAPSVLRLPPPLDRRHSVIDAGCARPDGAPVVIEVDHTNRARTVEKLMAEASAGRIAVWVRWGAAPFPPPPPPVWLVTCEVAHRNGPAGQGRLHTRPPVADRPAPAHSVGGDAVAAAVELPIPFPAPDGSRATLPRPP